MNESKPYATIDLTFDQFFAVQFALHAREAELVARLQVLNDDSSENHISNVQMLDAVRSSLALLKVNKSI